MGQKIYSSDDSLNNIVYHEMMRRAKDNPLEGLPVADVKRALAESFQVDINHRSDFHPLQKLAFDEMTLIQTAKSGIDQIEKALVRLQELGIDAMRSITSSERKQLDDEYQYLKKTIQIVGKETKIGGLSLLDVDPETLRFRMHHKTREILGSRQFLFAPEDPADDQELDEDTQIHHSVLTGRDAAKSISVLRQGMMNIEQVNGALGVVENRLVKEIKKFTLGDKIRPAISTRQAHALSIDVSNSIFQEAESALQFLDASSLRQIKSALF